MRIKLALLLLVTVAITGALCGQGPAPLTEKEVEKGIKSLAPEVVIQTVLQRGVDFDLTPEIEKKLRKAKATDQVVEAVKNAGPTARAAQRAQMGTGSNITVSPEEDRAFSALRNELEPDKAIQMASDYEKSFPNSPLLSYVHWFAASAYQQKGDLEKIIEYGDKSLKLKPDNLMSLMLMATMIPQPQYLNKHEMDKEKLLVQAETYANQALQEIEKQVTKQPNETDEAFQKRKEGLASGAHASLGMVHLERSSMTLTGRLDRDELAKAQEEYKLAVSSSDRPDPRDYYRLGEAYSLDGKFDEAIEAFTKAGDFGQGTMIKTLADQRIEDVKKRKAQAKPPANR